MDTAWIALIGTLFGGAALKIVEGLFAKGTTKVDLATSLREELRKESTQLKEEVRLAEHELDTWKEKYYNLYQEYIDIKQQVPKGPVDRGGEEEW